MIVSRPHPINKSLCSILRQIILIFYLSQGVYARGGGHSCDRECSDDQHKELNFFSDCCCLSCNNGERDYSEFPKFACCSYQNAWIFYTILGVPLLFFFYKIVDGIYQGNLTRAFIEILSKHEQSAHISNLNGVASNQWLEERKDIIPRIISLDIADSDLDDCKYTAMIDYIAAPPPEGDQQWCSHTEPITLSKRGYFILKDYISIVSAAGISTSATDPELIYRDLLSHELFEGFVLQFRSAQPGTLYLVKHQMRKGLIAEAMLKLGVPAFALMIYILAIGDLTEYIFVLVTNLLVILCIISCREEAPSPTDERMISPLASAYAGMREHKPCNTNKIDGIVDERTTDKVDYVQMIS